MNFARRSCLTALGGAAALATFSRVSPATALAVGDGSLTPEQFGARGDGRTNDTDAFARLAAHVNAAGGGEIVLRRTVYLVGRQVRAFRRGPQYAFDPAPIFEVRGCTRPLIIRGNGARLRCPPGLRYGTFDPLTGAKTQNPMPYTGSGELASPYRWMILVQNCSALVEISDLELDGGLKGHILGGTYGDIGRQIPSSGIALMNNEGPERLRRIYTHHHALDGLIIDGLDSDRGPQARSVIEDLRSEYNGRQGCSVVGGRGYDFKRCGFTGTGKAGLYSPPGAGVDIEAEGKRVRDLTFNACTFSNNTGCGMVADTGDSAKALFTDCTFIGTTNWGAWPSKPEMAFAGCTFVGPIVRCYGDRLNPARAARFTRCRFLDDPARSPTGVVYGGTNPDRPIADLSDARNVLFDRCAFTLTHDAVLPWSTGAIYNDCTLTQKKKTRAFPRGYYVGTNTIAAPVDLYSSKVNGRLTENGKVFVAQDSWSKD